jgi:hypothetical protein
MVEIDRRGRLVSGSGSDEPIAFACRHAPNLGTEIEPHLDALAQHLAGTFWAFGSTRAIRRPQTSPPPGR